jgi:hypothetical protein
MRIKTIDIYENWIILSEAMKEKGYSLWQFQYSADMPEGFHAWFWKKQKDLVEVITHNKDIQDAILNYNSER